MIKHTLPIFASLALVLSASAADSSVTLKKVHLCCEPCVEGVERSVKKIQGVSLKADEDAGTVTLTSSDKVKLQSALNAITEGGYFGESDSRQIKPIANTGAKDQKVQSITVEGVHLCCGGCVDAVDRALKNTPGATGHTATRKAKSFTVNGEFNDKKFFEALQMEGLNGKIANSAK